MGDALQAVKNWIKAPLTSPVDALHVFLFTGLVIVSALLWSRILAHLPVE